EARLSAWPAGRPRKSPDRSDLTHIRHAVSVPQLATRKPELLFVLEGHLDPGAKQGDLVVLDRHVELLDFGDAEVAQGRARALDGGARRRLPGLCAGTH